MKTLAQYPLFNEGVHAEVVIHGDEKEFVGLYELRHTRVKEATKAALNYLKERIMESVARKPSELMDPREAERVKARIKQKAEELVHTEFSGMNDTEEAMLVGRLIQEMLGLGELELVLADDQLEEVVINSAREPVWVYHKKFGWLKTNVVIATEEQIHNYASIIGRRVGKQITALEPLMDAHLLSGDRVNATLFPISTKGHAITIRKFARDPWTIVSFIDNHTLSAEAAALFWLALQYELNVLIGGGTASGKTSFLNAVLVFTPPNQRIITLEDTAELLLPEFLHWTPMVTRQPNPEGKGEVTLLDLMVNSLRMRPDRIVLGEIRRQREAEVLFEAMHTGHAVYATLHADSAAQVRQRLISPPINLPESVLGSLHLVAVQYRQRRTGIRRTFEIAEVVSEKDGIVMHPLYKWNARTDALERASTSSRLFHELSLHTGMTPREIGSDLKEKTQILKAMLEQGIQNTNDVGRIIAHYYREPQSVLETVTLKKPLKELT